jgi:biopolymer transport protein ExbD
MPLFRTGKKRSLPPINTASLPDCIFLLLFFFMVTTHFRQTNTRIMLQTPQASEVKKLEKKSLVSYIYVGTPIPQLQAIYGTEPRIQLNDAFATVDDIRDFISSEREQMSESEQKQMTVSLKIDKEAKMGLVSDVKQELRKANALKINYSASKGEPRPRQLKP